MARGFILWLLPLLALLCSPVHARSTITNVTELIEELSQLPQCAKTCATLLPATSCPLTDLNCLCTIGNPTNTTSDAQRCVLETCSIRDALTTQRVLEGICGVPVHRDGRTVIIVTVAFTVVVFLTCGIRLAVRARDFKLMGLDDAFIFGATVLTIPLAVCVFMLVNHGLGTSLWGVPYEDIQGIFFWFWLAEHFYIWSISLTKLSVLCFFLRVFTEPSFFWKTYVLLALTAACFVGTFFGAVFQCTPVTFAWNYWDKLHTGHCINLRGLLWSNSIINIVLDGLVILLPIPTLMSLTLPFWRKVGLFVVFSLGALTIIVASLRLKTFDDANFNTLDLTYDLRLGAIWSVAEVCVGIICVCLPAMRPFLRALRNLIFGEPAKDRYERQDDDFSGPPKKGSPRTPELKSFQTSEIETSPRGDSTEQLRRNEKR